MISAGNATVYVREMDRAVEFYVNTLGLKLTNRFGNQWATVDAGRGLMIGLHAESDTAPAPGTRGAMTLGFEIDEPMATIVKRLAARGVSFEGDAISNEVGEFAFGSDQDGNPFYFWEPSALYREATATATAASRA